jgi:hypothetical protein
MADFRYRGLDITDDWPAASKIKGAVRPDIERYFAHLPSGDLIWSHTQREMRDLLRQEVG